jgi:hypothetical protein
LAPDPSNPGHSALTYPLPFLVQPGDVVLTDNGVPGDVVRFLQLGSILSDGASPPSILIFYSDNVDGVDALADVGLPSGFFPNVILIPEVGPEGDNGAFYSPVPGQPGFPELDPVVVTYHFISDVSVPEPATLLLLTSGLVGISLVRRRQK